jgi:carboxypeptidase Ss1
VPSLLDEVKRLEPRIIEIRRTIHQNPELAYHEVATARLVARELRSLGIEVKTRVGGTGVVGLLRSGKKGRVVGLRADMDALPLQENVDVEFRSKRKGVMHACGHDTHVAMLLGAAMLLAKHRRELSGDVKFLFQPAEEEGGRGGAKPMIEAGALENPHVDNVFGLHISADFPSGSFGVRGGPFMARPDSIQIRVIGKGGHGAAPHKTVDPIYVAAQVIIALQGISSRMVNPIRPFVISVCSVHGGTKDNIIPDEVVLQGTMRTLEKETRAKAISDIRQVITYVCQAYGARCEIEFKKNPYPVTYNDEKAADRVMKVLKGIKGTRTRVMDQRLGAEDVSRFLQKAPGVFYYLGTNNPSKGCTAPNHSSRFKVDEDVLKYGSVSLAAVALEFATGTAPIVIS